MKLEPGFNHIGEILLPDTLSLPQSIIQICADLPAIRQRNQGWKAMKVRDIIRLLEDDGWYLVATKGSHKQYKHQTKK